MKYGMLINRRDLPTIEKQRAAMPDCDRFLTEPTYEMVYAVRPGQSLTVFSPKSFALERSNGYQPRKNAMKLLEWLDQNGITVHVVSTGKTYEMVKDSGQLSRDVLDALAGVRQVKSDPGRPSKPNPTKEQITEARAIWFDKFTYPSNTVARKAIKALKSYKWSDAQIVKYLGKSGRRPGRK